MIKAKVLAPHMHLTEVAELGTAVENAFTMAAKDVKVDFQVTTKTWEHQPEFTIEKLPEGRAVYTTDQVYAWVNDGTKPHLIMAKDAPVLAFPEKFGPKTRPGAIRSNKGHQGGKTIFTTQVNHPGTEPRKFDEAIEKKWQEKFPQLLQRAIDAALAKGGA